MRDINPPGIGGRILNVTSIAGYCANPVHGFYSAAKFGELIIISTVRVSLLLKDNSISCGRIYGIA